MIRSVKAIVRVHIPGCPFKPGDVVRVSSLAFKRGFGNRFPATPENSPNPLHWMDPEHLLLYADFLTRQPIDEFWELRWHPSMIACEDDQFFMHPKTEKPGPRGYRFESLGEILHYIQYRNLTRYKLSISHTNKALLHFENRE